MDYKKMARSLAQRMLVADQSKTAFRPLRLNGLTITFVGMMRTITDKDVNGEENPESGMDIGRDCRGLLKVTFPEWQGDCSRRIGIQIGVEPGAASLDDIVEFVTVPETQNVSDVELWQTLFLQWYNAQ